MLRRSRRANLIPTISPTNIFKIVSDQAGSQNSLLLSTKKKSLTPGNFAGLDVCSVPVAHDVRRFETATRLGSLHLRETRIRRRPRHGFRP